MSAGLTCASACLAGADAIREEGCPAEAMEAAAIQVHAWICKYTISRGRVGQSVYLQLWSRGNRDLISLLPSFPLAMQISNDHHLQDTGGFGMVFDSLGLPCLRCLPCQ